jgi:hypothetical protein
MPQVEKSFDLFFSLSDALPVRDIPPPPAPRGYSRRPPPCSPLPPTALRAAGHRGRTRVSCQISPVSIFNFPHSLSLHGSMVGRPSPTTMRRMHATASMAYFFSILKFIYSLVVLHTNDVARYIYFEESVVVYWS